MNKQQVKVMVGSTWENKEISTYSVRVSNLINDLVQLNHSDGTISTVYLARFYELFTFVPANDLEWLAVNYKEWMNSIAVGIEKVGETYSLHTSCWLELYYSDIAYTRQQWHDMRVHLGLETNEITTEEIDMLTKDDKPVFTKAMKDDDENIQLGMLYHDENGDECEFIGENNIECVWVGKLTRDGIHPRHLSVSQRSECTPIDTRTHEERLIDDASHMLHTKGFSHDKLMLKCLLSYGYITRKES